MGRVFDTTALNDRHQARVVNDFVISEENKPMYNFKGIIGLRGHKYESYVICIKVTYICINIIPTMYMCRRHLRKSGISGNA